MRTKLVQRRRRRRLIGVKRFLYETRRRKLAHADCFAPARQIPLDLRRRSRLRVSSQWSSVVLVLVPATILYVRAVVITISSGRILYDNDDDDDIILIYCIAIGAIESRHRWRVPPHCTHLRFHKHFTISFRILSSDVRVDTIQSLYIQGYPFKYLPSLFRKSSDYQSMRWNGGTQKNVGPLLPSSNFI